MADFVSLRPQTADPVPYLKSYVSGEIRGNSSYRPPVSLTGSSVVTGELNHGSGGSSSSNFGGGNFGGSSTSGGFLPQGRGGVAENAPISFAQQQQQTQFGQQQQNQFGQPQQNQFGQTQMQPQQNQFGQPQQNQFGQTQMQPQQNQFGQPQQNQFGQPQQNQFGQTQKPVIAADIYKYVQDIDKAIVITGEEWRGLLGENYTLETLSVKFREALYNDISDAHKYIFTDGAGEDIIKRDYDRNVGIVLSKAKIEGY